MQVAGYQKLLGLNHGKAAQRAKTSLMQEHIYQCGNHRIFVKNLPTGKGQEAPKTSLIHSSSALAYSNHSSYA